MQGDVKRRAIVNTLTVMRLPFAILGTWAALQRDALSTITFGAAAVATDMGDGIFARRWDIETEWGSNLDSAMDFIFYAALFYQTYLFVPDDIERHIGLFSTFFILYCSMLLGGFLFRRSIADHGRLSRATATVGSLSAAWWIAVGYQEWMLLVTALFATADIGHRLSSIVRALALRRRGAAPSEDAEG